MAALALEPLVSRSFLDQIDADRSAIEFISEKCRQAKKTTPHAVIRSYAHEQSDGRTRALWVGGSIVALAVVERDDLNHSVLVFCG